MLDHKGKVGFFMPVIFIVLLVVLLFQGLWREEINPTEGLVNQSLPDFHLPDLMDPEMFYSKSLLKGKIAVINVWATWCSPCAQEHPFLVQLSKNQLIPIYGLNYHDEKSQAIDWLKQRGNPYRAVIFDGKGQTAVDWGIVGVPETFVVDTKSVIRYRHQGILTEEIWENKILPVIETLENEMVEHVKNH